MIAQVGALSSAAVPHDRRGRQLRRLVAYAPAEGWRGGRVETLVIGPPSARPRGRQRRVVDPPGGGAGAPDWAGDTRRGFSCSGEASGAPSHPGGGGYFADPNRRTTTDQPSGWRVSAEGCRTMPHAEEEATTSVAKRNIEAISELEHRAVAQRSAAQRFSEAVVDFAGSIRFMLVQVAAIAAWIVWNLPALSPFPTFDPYPFSLLGMAASAEAIFLSLFILTGQKRLQRQADHRAHLDLQISMLSEAEATKTLEMLRALCAHFGLEQAKDEEMLELADRINPEGLLADIKQSLPGSD
jgi:uncharacterized membrane protein